MTDINWYLMVPFDLYINQLGRRVYLNGNLLAIAFYSELFVGRSFDFYAFMKNKKIK